MKTCRQTFPARNAEICCRPCDANIEEAMEELRLNLGEVVYTQEEDSLKLQALDIPNVEHANLLCITDDSSFWTSDDLNAVISKWSFCR